MGKTILLITLASATGLSACRSEAGARHFDLSEIGLSYERVLTAELDGRGECTVQITQCKSNTSCKNADEPGYGLDLLGIAMVDPPVISWLER